MTYNSEMLKGFFIGMVVVFVIIATIFFIYREFNKSNKNSEVEAVTIMKSVQNISKMMLIESQFSEVYTFKENDKIFFNLIPTKKEAILILQAKAQVGYDLKKVKIDIDKVTRTVRIVSLPKEEIIIDTDLKFYDIKTSTFSSFTPDDINKVQADAKHRIEIEIDKSGIKLQAHDRLVESLQSIVNVSSALGWNVKDDTKSIGFDLLK